METLSTIKKKNPSYCHCSIDVYRRTNIRGVEIGQNAFALVDFRVDLLAVSELFSFSSKVVQFQYQLVVADVSVLSGPDFHLNSPYSIYWQQSSVGQSTIVNSMNINISNESDKVCIGNRPIVVPTESNGVCGQNHYNFLIFTFGFQRIFFRIAQCSVLRFADNSIHIIWM